MLKLNIKPTHKAVKQYYQTLARYGAVDVTHEQAVKTAFHDLLKHYCSKIDWTLVPEFPVRKPKGDMVRVDGALVDNYRLTHGYWEAKDTHDDLEKEVSKKFAAGYPKDNILFQAPDRAVLYQDKQLICDEEIKFPDRLVRVLQLFFEYRPSAYEQWEEAVARFKEKVPDLACGLMRLIDEERKSNKKFISAFSGFMELCKQSINPNIAEDAVIEMLIQHLLTKRIFRKVFNNPDFRSRNIVAVEIEKVISALTSRSFSRHDFLERLDPFYMAIERAASTIHDFSQKQQFLNTVYEQFFQGFSVEVADTHGIVYTPQEIVEFMVNSVEDILKNEFGKSLSHKNVHILDPFVGTGNFIVHIMRKIKKTALKRKYENELHCNEVMLLPYYIASMNIEHEYYDLTSQYEPYDGICLVDTFELAEQQTRLFNDENTARAERQRSAPIFVIIGNPPYNQKQVNENDNNKNRKYKIVDGRIKETYAKDSKATLKAALSDVYVRAIRWASDRVGDEGIVAFVSNNYFINGYAFDGMRKHLKKDFSAVYHVDLKGNARTSGERRRREAGNVFDDMIRVGVGITFFVKRKECGTGSFLVKIYSVGDYMASTEKKQFLEHNRCLSKLSLEPVVPDTNHTWLTEGLRDDFETLIPLGTKGAKAGDDRAAEAVFHLFSSGVKTNRDAWAYNFDKSALESNMRLCIEVYNQQVDRWQRLTDKSIGVDDFVTYDETALSWSGDLKKHLLRGRLAEFSDRKVRKSLYRPFAGRFLFFDHLLNNRRYRFPRIFPTPDSESENRVICTSGIGSSKPFQALAVSLIPCLDMLEKTQCFPFYTYDGDGTNRRENITDWALEEFRAHYKSKRISKWDIFYYVYGVLNHPEYGERYAANLRRELPRVPFVPEFDTFSKAGKKLAELHINYEDQQEYPLERNEKEGAPLDWRVGKMKLSKDKTQIIYNDFLTLGGVPPEAFEYKLGDRSTIHWIIDQYRVKTDKRSSILNDPNRPDDPEHIVRLIGKVVTVSLETVKIIKSLPLLRTD